MMIRSTCPRYPRSFFKWSTAASGYVAEISELTTGRKISSLIYHDRADEGFLIALEDHRLIPVVLVREHTVADEVSHWEFRAVDEAYIEHPCLIDVKILVLND